MYCMVYTVEAALTITARHEAFSNICFLPLTTVGQPLKPLFFLDIYLFVGWKKVDTKGDKLINTARTSANGCQHQHTKGGGERNCSKITLS